MPEFWRFGGWGHSGKGLRDQRIRAWREALGLLLVAEFISPLHM